MKSSRHLFALLALSIHARAQTNLTPASSLAYSANAGWIDPKAGDGAAGLIAGQCVCAGFLYSANCGWINMGDGTPHNGAQYANTSGADFGVNRLPGGKLRGLAWGANIGWINFEDTGDPRVDPVTRQLLGHAWSASAGWISLANTSGGIFQQNTDADNDGLPDAWESTWSQPALLSTTGDLDSDGFTDAAEYAAGTDPTASDSNLLMLNMVTNTNTVSLTWTSVSGRNYRVQASSDLTNWSYVNFAVIPPANALLAAGASNAATTTRLVMKPAGDRMFYRVLALKPPAAP